MDIIMSFEDSYSLHDFYSYSTFDLKVEEIIQFDICIFPFP